MSIDCKRKEQIVRGRGIEKERKRGKEKEMEREREVGKDGKRGI